MEGWTAANHAVGIRPRDGASDGTAPRMGPMIGQFVRAQALTYVKSTSINLMAGVPSYFSGSNPYLSNLRLAARSTCDLN